MGGKGKTLRVSEKTHDRVEKFCALTGKSMQSVADRAIDNYMNDEAPIWEQAARDAAGNKKN